MSSRGKRPVERTAVKHALRKETRRRDVIREMKSRPRKIETKPPPPEWSIGETPSKHALDAVRMAHRIFGREPGVDAALGWLFRAYPAYGASGSDMVAHHVMLSSDTYYGRWVALCSALQLFPRDP